MSVDLSGRLKRLQTHTLLPLDLTKSNFLVIGADKSVIFLDLSFGLNYKGFRSDVHFLRPFFL